MNAVNKGGKRGERKRGGEVTLNQGESPSFLVCMVLGSNPIKVIDDDRKSIQSQLLLSLRNYNPVGQG